MTPISPRNEHSFEDEGFVSEAQRQQARAFFAAHRGTGLIGNTIARLNPQLSTQDSASLDSEAALRPPPTRHAIKPSDHGLLGPIPIDLAASLSEPHGIHNPLSKWLAAHTGVFVGAVPNFEMGTGIINLHDQLTARRSHSNPGTASAPAAPGGSKG